jgi:hypothetical protein
MEHDEPGRTIIAALTLSDLNQQAAHLLEALSDQDYLIYKGRWIAFGEEAAVRLVIAKYGSN